MAINSASTLTGLFKETYGSSVIDLAGGIAKLTREIRFEEREAIGNKYHQPVRVKHEHTFTYAAAGSTATWTAGSYTEGALADAQIEGAQIIGRSAVNYDAIARSMNGDKSAFISATKEVVRALSTSATKRVEVGLLHGRRGIATITASSVSGNATLTISDESWSAGLWSGMEGCELDAYQSDLTTQVNTNAALVVVSVNTSNKQVVVSGNATDLGNLANTNVLFFRTASTSTEAPGLDAIARNTGTLYNISASTYSLWGGNVYSTATGPLSLSKLLDAAGIAASYEASGRMLAVVAPRAFEVLNSDESALRRYQVERRQAQNGFQYLSFYSQNGSLEIMPHPYQKDGLAHLFMPDEALRVGATDLTFIRRHGDQEALILEISNSSAAEMRCYSHQALFIEQPRHTVVLAGITY